MLEITLVTARAVISANGILGQISDLKSLRNKAVTLKGTQGGGQEKSGLRLLGSLTLFCHTYLPSSACTTVYWELKGLEISQDSSFIINLQNVT